MVSGEAHLIALACGAPPEGRADWTLHMLADRLVECEVVESISYETGTSDAEKNELKPWLKECWCLPPQGNAEFVCAMEDVLEVYHREYQENEVLVCLDETSKQQVNDPAAPSTTPRICQSIRFRVPAQRGEQPVHAIRPAGRVAAGGSNPKADQVRLGWQVVRKLVDEDYAHKDRIVLVDGQPEHPPPGVPVRRPFEPAEARRIAQRLEIHYTPKHGSWLNIAEIELGVLSRQCLDRRIPDQEILEQEDPGLAGPAEPGRDTSGLAFHHRRCA